MTLGMQERRHLDPCRRRRCWCNMIMMALSPPPAGNTPPPKHWVTSVGFSILKWHATPNSIVLGSARAGTAALASPDQVCFCFVNAQCSSLIYCMRKCHLLTPSTDSEPSATTFGTSHVSHFGLYTQPRTTRHCHGQGADTCTPQHDVCHHLLFEFHHIPRLGVAFQSHPHAIPPPPTHTWM